MLRIIFGDAKNSRELIGGMLGKLGCHLRRGLPQLLRSFVVFLSYFDSDAGCSFTDVGRRTAIRFAVSDAERSICSADWREPFCCWCQRSFPQDVP